MILLESKFIVGTQEFVARANVNSVSVNQGGHHWGSAQTREQCEQLARLIATSSDVREVDLEVNVEEVAYLLCWLAGWNQPRLRGGSVIAGLVR